MKLINICFYSVLALATTCAAYAAVPLCQGVSFDTFMKSSNQPIGAPCTGSFPNYTCNFNNGSVPVKCSGSGTPICQITGPSNPLPQVACYYSSCKSTWFLSSPVKQPSC